MRLNVSTAHNLVKLTCIGTNGISVIASGISNRTSSDSIPGFYKVLADLKYAYGVETHVKSCHKCSLFCPHATHQAILPCHGVMDCQVSHVMKIE